MVRTCEGKKRGETCLLFLSFLLLKVRLLKLPPLVHLLCWKGGREGKEEEDHPVRPPPPTISLHPESSSAPRQRRNVRQQRRSRLPPPRPPPPPQSPPCAGGGNIFPPPTSPTTGTQVKEEEKEEDGARQQLGESERRSRGKKSLACLPASTRLFLPLHEVVGEPPPPPCGDVVVSFSTWMK